MALNFPNSGLYPGYQYTGDNGVIYIYDGVKWVGHAPNATAGTNSITNGSNTVQVDGSGNLVTPAYTFPGTTGTNGQVLKWPTSGTVLEWSNDNNSGGGGGITDVVQDTSPQLGANLDVNGHWITGGSYDGNTLILPVGGGATLTSGYEGGVTLRASTNNTDFAIWNFAADKSLTLANGAKLDGGTSYKFATDNSVTQYIDLRDTSGRGFYTDSNGYTLRSNGSNNWIFGTDGSLTLPNNSSISDELVVQYSSSFSMKTYQWNGTEGYFTSDVGVHGVAANALIDTVRIGWYVSGPGLIGVKQITNIAGEGNGYDYAIVVDLTDGSTWSFGDNTYTFYSPDYALVSNGTKLRVNSNQWTFDNNGNTTVPNNILAQPGNDLKLTVFNPNAEGGVSYVIENRQVDIDSKTTQFVLGPRDLTITTDFTGSRNEWTFDNTGTIHLPVGGDIVDSNGVTVLGGAAYDQNLNTTDNVTFNKVSPTTIEQGNAIRTQGTLNTSVLGSSSTVVFSAPTWMTSIKLLISVEGRLDGDGTGTDHTQTAEATIAMTYNTNAEPVMSVYGVVYTCPTPLATFTVRRTGVTGGGNIEVVALNSQTLEALTVRVLATQFVSIYD